MRCAWSAMLGLVMAGVAWADDDEEAKSKNKNLLDEETYLQLLERVKKLEERQQNDARERLNAAVAREKQRELEELPQRVSKLEKAQPDEKNTWDPFKFLTFSTPDGNFTARIGGRIYIVGRHVFDRDDGAGGNPDNFLIDDARIQLEGTFFKDFFYRLETSGKTGSPSTAVGAQLNNEIFVGYGGLKDYATIQFGQYKQPFSQEETTSSRFIDFAERSLLNLALVVPQRDVGVTLYGGIADNLVQWTVGAFNASGVGKPKNIADINDEKDVVGRVFINPFKKTDGVLKGLRVGLDFTVGDVDGPVALGAITSGDYSGATLVPATAAELDGLRTRYLANFSWLYGPVSLRAEYGLMNQELQESYAPAGDFDITAWYVAATWLITGEDKALENRVKPHANLNPLEGNWGALELVARICQIDAEDVQDAGLIGAAANTEAREITVGLNWWWTHNMVLRINWEHITFDEDLPVGTGDSLEDSQDIFYVRWQVDF